jgi:dipeptidyl aminopeptidase/acylaminoacyl peptidase
MFPNGFMDDSFLYGKLHIIERASGVMREFSTTTRSTVLNPQWSPDGRWIAWRMGNSDTDASTGTIYIAPADAAKEAAPRLISEKLDGTAVDIAWSYEQSATLRIQSIVGQHTATRLLNIETGKVESVIGRPFISTELPSMSQTGRWAFAAEQPQHPAELYCGRGRSNPVRVTNVNPALKNFKLGEQSVISWPSSDGFVIEGVLIKPVGWSSDKRYPLIVFAHGGSETADLDGWHGSWLDGGQLWAARGYTVLYPNYRGSIGRGAAFTQTPHNDPMGGEYEDIENGARHLIGLDIADPQRVGIFGHSWGGYMAAAAATVGSKVFSAAVVSAGFTNWISHIAVPPHGSSPVHDQLAHLSYRVYEPGRLLEVFKASPIFHINTADTPTLFLHGLADEWVSHLQASELYYALKWRGVETQMIKYPGGGHAPTKPEQRQDFLLRAMAWFERYIGDGTNKK